MNSKAIIGLVIALIGLLLFLSSVFVVTAGHRVLLFRLGHIITNASGQPLVLNSGLHFKLPVIVVAQDFDVRLQSVTVESSRILTAEQKYVIVDYYAKWRIEDLALYYKRTGGFSDRAEMLLQQKINDALRAAFGKRDIKDVISSDRLNIIDTLRKKANDSAKELGIRVVDVRIKGIDLPREVRDSVFERMRTEREQVATQHRAEGKAMAESLRADADATVAIEIAKAKAEAQKTRAVGDAQAAVVYAQAYEQNADFYAFYRSMQAYQNVFQKKNNVMVLKPEGQFFKYFLPTGKSHIPND